MTAKRAKNTIDQLAAVIYTGFDEDKGKQGLVSYRMLQVLFFVACGGITYTAFARQRDIHPAIANRLFLQLTKRGFLKAGPLQMGAKNSKSYALTKLGWKYVRAVRDALETD